MKLQAPRTIVMTSIAAFLLVTGYLLRTAPARSAQAAPSKPASTDDHEPPWTTGQTIDAPTLAKALSGSKAANANPPLIVCVGFHTLYEGAHIPGASLHGPGSTPQGLDALKQWAKPLPRNANIIIYCGCCPLAHCPNVRPAFTALRDMGFTHLRVLILLHDFATDWVGPGYPIEKGK